MLFLLRRHMCRPHETHRREDEQWKHKDELQSLHCVLVGAYHPRAYENNSHVKKNFHGGWAHLSMMFVCAIYAEGAAALRFCRGG